MLNVILRTIFLYVFVLIIFRLMGKREIGTLSIQDFVVSILMAELVAISIENYKDSMLFTIVPILLLLIMEILSAFLSLKSNKFRNIVDGRPSLIINKGKINYKEMIKQRYSLDDLMIELRNNSISDLKEVEYAVLENNGKLNIFKYKFLGINGNLPFPLILDGNIQYDTLKHLNKKENWITNYLDENNILKEDVFYAFYKNNNIYIIKKNELS